MQTGTSSFSAGLKQVTAGLYSDLAVHHMGTGPANGGLLMAINAHASSGSKVNQVINNFNQMTAQQRQDLLNFLRSL
jgi:hypothetical protein